MKWFSKNKELVVTEPAPSTRKISVSGSGSKNLIRRSYKRKRAYEAAKNTRFMSSWTNSPSPINYQITSVLHTLIARSREAYQNNDLVRRAVSLRKSKTIGHTGIRFVPKIKTGGKLDSFINKQISSLLKKAGKKGVLDVKGKLSLIDIQNRVEHQLFVDGEYICIHRYSKTFDLAYAIDEVDPMLLPVKLNKDLKNGNIIRCGVELNQFKRPVAYHFIKSKDSMNRTNDHAYMNREDTVRIKAEYVTHVFQQEFPDQLRGIPKIATGLFRIEVLRKYIEAELIGARIGASSAGFFVRQKDFVDPYDGTGDIDITDEEKEDIPDEDLEDEELDEVEAGSVKIAPLGYDFKAWDLNRPNSAFGDFLRENNRSLASSTDMSYSALTNDYSGVSFSSLRDAKLTDEEIIKQGQVFHTEHFLEPVIFKMISISIDFGRFVVKDAVRRPTEEYLEGEFVPPVSKWVDPVKTAQAYRILNKELGVMARERICGELGILDPEAEFEAIKLENERFPVHNENNAGTVTSDKEIEADEQESKKEEKS